MFLSPEEDDVFLCQSAFNAFPIDEAPEVLHVVRPAVSIVNIVGVFPDVQCEQWRHAVCVGVSGVGQCEDVESVAFVGCEPDPS